MFSLVYRKNFLERCPTLLVVAYLGGGILQFSNMPRRFHLSVVVNRREGRHAMPLMPTVARCRIITMSIISLQLDAS